MTPRAAAMRRHRMIFQYALEHGLDLPTAERRMLADDRRLAAEAEALRAQCGTDYRRSERSKREPSTILGRSLSGAPDQPWMMRD